MSSSEHPAFDTSALFAKSQTYMARAYRAEQGKNEDEYQLWASLALELLAKSTLSFVHPALVADPQHYQSLFAACGVDKQLDVKTIAASTLFKRLSHLSKQFDIRVKNFCDLLSSRRNSELHSGESPFLGMKAAAWESQFWHTTHTLLEMQDKDLSDWLQPDDANARNQFLHDSKEALKKSISVRIEHRRKDFLEKYDDENSRQTAIASSATHLPSSAWRELSLDLDSSQSTECPACKATAVIGGTFWDEEVIDTDYNVVDEPPVEIVETTYATEELYCPVCDLRLKGVQEVEASGISTEFTKTDDRYMEYEPDYGND